MTCCTSDEVLLSSEELGLILKMLVENLRSYPLRRSIGAVPLELFEVAERPTSSLNG